MAATQVTQSIEVVDGLRCLAQEIGYEVVIQPGPMDSVVVVVWEIATVSINSRFPVKHQAEELIYTMALLVERLERRARGPQLTFCQQAQIVDTVALRICAKLGLVSDRPTSLSIPGVWADVDATTLTKAEDLVARVMRRLSAHVIAGSR